MEEGSQQFQLEQLVRLRQDGAHVGVPLPQVVIHFAVEPAKTVTRRLASRSELRVHGESLVWLTRECSTFDYWLRPGESLRFERAERIWLSVESGPPGEVTITSRHDERARALAEWLAGVGPWLSRRVLPRGL